MQLGAPTGISPLRSRLRAAACMLLASGATTTAGADPGATTQLDATALLYGESQRARVVEPTLRVTRLYADGQSLSGQVGLDVITGSSPTGALPPGRVQTTTSASGTTRSIPADLLPMTSFKDVRVALDGEWVKPFARLLKSTLGGHFSREKDYQSLGANAKVSFDLPDRLTTLTAGAGFNRDSEFPVGGITDGLVVPPAPPPGGEEEEGGVAGTGRTDSKRVTSGLLGLSRVVTRRWLLGVNGSRTAEDGYLTEAYKIVSLLDPTSGLTVGELTEKRPTSRLRTAFLGSSVYHFTDDVLYLSYRRYWDDWSVRSNTFDLQYRHERDNAAWVQPHLRYYTQTAADFFTFGLIQGAALPEFATSDARLGPLRTLTLGVTYGFHLTDYPGEFSIRAEFMRQFGDGHPANTVGVQRGFDLFPAVDIGSLVVSYSVEF